MGNPVVSYHDVTKGDLKVVHCSHLSCTNAVPVAQDDGYTVTAVGSLSVEADMGVLANDSDPDPEHTGLAAHLLMDVSSVNGRWGGSGRLRVKVRGSGRESGGLVTAPATPASAAYGTAHARWPGTAPCGPTIARCGPRPTGDR